MDSLQSKTALAVDSAVGALAVTTPLWLVQLEILARGAVLIGGVVLIAMRIAIAIRQYRAMPRLLRDE